MVVLVKLSKYLAAENKFLTKFQNVNVLVGAQSAIDVIVPKVKAFTDSLNGTFEVINRT